MLHGEAHMHIMIEDVLIFQQDNLSFPLICPDWNADEEMLLLEGIEMYGFGNWTEVSEHVGTRRRQQCIDHYNAIYMNSPCFPLPDMSRVMGKSREDLLALSKGSGEIKKELPMFMEITLKEESPFSPRVKSEEPKKTAASKASSHSTADGVSGAGKKASSKLQIKDEPKVTKVEESQRSIGGKKLRSVVEEGPSVTELSGYNYKRQEFEIEYDNDAEQILADMEFHDTDTDGDRELKLRVLHVYGKRLDERKRRKDFVLERNLLHPDPLEKNLSPEVREIHQRFKVFMRFHSNEDHKELLKSIIEEQQIVKRILDLQEAQAAGCRTATEASNYLKQKRKNEIEQSLLKIKENAQAGASGKILTILLQEAQAAGCRTATEASNYLEQKRKNEIEQSLLKIKENAQAGASGKILQQISPWGAAKGSAILHPGPKDLSLITQSISNSLDDWDISGLMGADLLSETEKRLCCELRILPSHYLHMLQTISTETLNGNVKKKSEAHSLFKVDPDKVDRVYDMVIQKGLTLA
ncbi:hypothetical protein ACLB2K_067350 [Fragaria x ananassa]